MSEDQKACDFIWYELLTADPDAAVEFFSEVIGWGSQVWEGGERPYRMWTAADVPVAGTMELPADARAAGTAPHWLPYIGTPDIAATVACARGLAAQIHLQPMKITGVGRIAVVADPQGAVFALHQPDAEPPAGPEAPQPGLFSWHELLTTDQEAAFDFYHELFGWEKTDSMDLGEMGLYQMYGLAGTTLGGMYNKPSDVPAPAHWLLYIMVKDVYDAADTVRKLGGEVLHDPMTVPGGDRVVRCTDPQGALFALHSKAPEGAEGGAPESGASKDERAGGEGAAEGREA
jgi:predicted enzyme related to lactoylglutathione lyase